MGKTKQNTSQLFGCFDAVYIINFPLRADRRKEMEADLNNHDLNWYDEIPIVSSAIDLLRKIKNKRRRGS